MSEAQQAPAPRRAGGARLVAANGLFALVVGLLLRRAVGSQDRTDWNGAVRAFLEVFPLLLIAGGALLLIVAVARTQRLSAGGDPALPTVSATPSAGREAGSGAGSPDRAADATASTEPAPRPAKPVDHPSSGKAYAAEQRAALARLRAARDAERPRDS
jgi:hypothetical protein